MKAWYEEKLRFYVDGPYHSPAIRWEATKTEMRQTSLAYYHSVGLGDE